MANKMAWLMMATRVSWNKAISAPFFFIIIYSFLPFCAVASEAERTPTGNFGLPGIIDLPTARRFPDGEFVITQQFHKSLARLGISFQALPRLGVAFRYTGHGINGVEAYGRVNHDRSFDAQISVLDEGIYFPAISLGLRDFIGTGWYSSEYIVGTKSFSNFELTAGLGFGRLAQRNSFSNPLGALSSRFDQREINAFGRGGTLGTINWFQGDAAAFYGIQYHVNEKVTLSSEYTTDLMSQENSYLSINSPWNFGASYRLNNYVNFSGQYLHGSQVSITAQISFNPDRPPFLGGKELAPVPMRLRGGGSLPVSVNDESTIKKVLKADRFEIHYIKFESDTVHVGVNNTKFRSQAQALGRVTSTLQRFTSDKITIANISFYSQGLRVSSYKVDLEKVAGEQFNPITADENNLSITATDIETVQWTNNRQRFTWGIGPYFEHRLFNPDLPLSMETGVEVAAGYQIAPGLEISGAVRKSVLTNLTDNQRRSNSVLPRVHSDWPLYDIAGQSGYIPSLTLSYVKNLAPGLYGRGQAGLLEPFFAGIGGELLYKPAKWPIGIGVDVHRVRKRDYEMQFDLLDYETTVGHISLYYDAGGMFDIEINSGRYLAGDWGTTTTISRKFGSGWEVGGYATLTDVPFDTFGEGSFDKAIFVRIPIDWIVSSPNRIERRITIRPITRDGGAHLSNARQLYRQIEGFQNASFKREFGRLWK